MNVTYNLNWGKELYYYSDDYFCITPMENDTKIAFTIDWTYFGSTISSISDVDLSIDLEYSFDKTNWTKYTVAVQQVDLSYSPVINWITTSIPVFFRGFNGNGLTKSIIINDRYQKSQFLKLYTNKRFILSGKLASLITKNLESAILVTNLLSANSGRSSTFYSTLSCPTTGGSQVLFADTKCWDASRLIFNFSNTNVPIGGMYRIFADCKELKQIPELKFTNYEMLACASMYNGCSKLKLSTTQTGEYQIQYRIPSQNIGIAHNEAFNSMFASTGGTFTGTPSINTTYYISKNKI